MSQSLTGALRKMQSSINEQKLVTYRLPIGKHLLSLNELIGKKITLKYQAVIHCCHCSHKIKKTFSQGFCYSCFKKLPQCDICIMRPEKCHYYLGTCRDKEWGDRFCMTDHVVYLANSSGMKVGITRATQIPVRWIDQGATQALPIMRVSTRYQSGLVETFFKEFINDRTNWQAMLKGPADPLDLKAAAMDLLKNNQTKIQSLQKQFGVQAINSLVQSTGLGSDVVEMHYPVLQYPTKVTSMSFDKISFIEGVLQGIKGQYLMLDTGVINIRKHTAYQVKVCIES